MKKYNRILPLISFVALTSCVSPSYNVSFTNPKDGSILDKVDRNVDFNCYISSNKRLNLDKDRFYINTYRFDNRRGVEISSMQKYFPISDEEKLENEFRYKFEIKKEDIPIIPGMSGLRAYITRYKNPGIIEYSIRDFLSGVDANLFETGMFVPTLEKQLYSESIQLK